VHLAELEADRLRNLKAVSLALPSGLSVIVGRNGQGKSSLLESIYLLATGRSFRTARNEELIVWNGGPLRVAGIVASRVGRTSLSVVLDAAGRRLVVEGGERDLAGYLGRLDLVELTGERMRVLRGPPDERRRFLDRGVVGLTTGFLERLAEYRRVLAQRNALLRRRGAGTAELDVWDTRLVASGGALHRERRRYAVRLGAALGEPSRLLFPEGGELRLSYRPSPAAAVAAEPHEFERVFAEALGRTRAYDLGLGHTGLGPHRDDLLVELEGTDLRRYGSAGQVRAAMVALKLAKLALLGIERGETPLFLMDDYDSDLDEVRAAALADYLHRGGFQALVASSKETLIHKLGVTFTKLRMDDGRVGFD
jgi:DNA replication and repair protein RecF